SFLSEIFTPLVKQVRDLASGVRTVAEEPTGWAKVDRTAAEIRLRLASADSAEKFQAVGLLAERLLFLWQKPSTNDRDTLLLTALSRAKQTLKGCLNLTSQLNWVGLPMKSFANMPAPLLTWL